MKINQRQWRFYFLSTLLLGFLLSSPLLAEEDTFDGHWFLRACQQSLAGTEGDSQATFTGGYCYGYLAGLRHAGEIANQVIARPELWGQQLWCIPKEESLEAVKRAVVDALGTYTDNRESAYSVSVMQSLKKCYPCL